MREIEKHIALDKIVVATSAKEWFEILRRFRDANGIRIFPDEKAEVICKYMNLLRDYFYGEVDFFNAPPEMTIAEMANHQISDYESGKEITKVFK